MNAVQLLGPDGKLIDRQAMGLMPHYQTFASIVSAVNKTYSYRWDEAVRDSRINALAMRRDAYLKALLQERKKPTAKLKWSIEVDNPNDPMQKLVKEGLTRSIKSTWRWRRMLSNLLEALWYGRYAVQIDWSRDQNGQWHIRHHRPVNGDKIQFQWDGTPALLIQAGHTKQYTDIQQDAVTPTDAGGWALRLCRPEWRNQFVIHQHDVEDADFFEGEMAGGVQGIGLRSWAYWTYWMRQEMLDWMTTFMEGVGMMDMLIFNYADGNQKAQQAAEANARKISGKMALTMPRAATEKFQAVETLGVNVAGVVALKGMIESYFERHLERLFVGQTLSSGTEGSGLGGTGVADLHRDTKFHLIEDDADNLSETLTADVAEPLKKFNYPWADFPAWLRLAVTDPEQADKVDTGIKLAGAGVRIKASELREPAGFSEPGPDDECVGGSPDSPLQGILANQLPQREQYSKDAEGHEHSESDGRFVGTGGRDKESKSGKSGRATTEKPATKVGKVYAAAKSAISAAMDTKLGRFAAKAEHKLAFIAHKVREIATAAAEKRGFTPEQTERLRKTLARADFAGGYITGGITAATVNPWAGKAVSIMLPSASVAYLAYSTAKNPKATWAAARDVISKTIRGKSQPHEGH